LEKIGLARPALLEPHAINLRQMRADAFPVYVVRAGFCRALLVQGAGCLSVLQWPPDGADSCASRRPRHSPRARAAVGDLRTEAIAMLPRRPACGPHACGSAPSPTSTASALPSTTTCISTRVWPTACFSPDPLAPLSAPARHYHPPTANTRQTDPPTGTDRRPTDV